MQFQYACQSNHLTTIRLLIQRGGAQIQGRNANTGWVPLHEAASRGLSEVVQLLLGLNAPAHPRTSNGETPLILAQRKGFQECVEILSNKIVTFFNKSCVSTAVFIHLYTFGFILQAITRLGNQYFQNTIGTMGRYTEKKP